jgi:hypothetical protein
LRITQQALDGHSSPSLARGARTSASAQQKQQPKELLFVLALAMVSVDDLRAETPSISTSSLVCSSKRRSAKKFLQWAVVRQKKLVAT